MPTTLLARDRLWITCCSGWLNSRQSRTRRFATVILTRLVSCSQGRICLRLSLCSLIVSNDRALARRFSPNRAVIYKFACIAAALRKLAAHKIERSAKG